MKKKNPAHTPDPRDTSGAIDNRRSNRGSSRSRSRRKFLGDVGGITAATLVAGVAGTPVLESVAIADELDAGPLTGPARAEKAFNTRMQAALFQKILPLPDQPNNGDEDLFGNRIGNFGKGLPHNQLGEVDRDAYGSLLKAVTTGDPVDFDAIILGGSFKLTSPQAGFAFDMQGADPGHLYQPPAPAFASAEEAGEIAENYWMALTPYSGSSLTVGGELNKLASNIAIGRNGAGVHWRSDAWESLKLGEAMAISILQDFRGCYNERFTGFRLTKFDGSKVIVG